MTNSAARIQCINHKCQTLNLLNRQFCSKCRTPIIKRYLWSLGEGIKFYQIGDLINDRYLLKQEKIVLDTQPALPPPLPESIPSEIESYLRLFSYRVYLPQIYGYIKNKEPIWLLEYGSVPTDGEGELINPKLFLPFDEAWPQASPLRQLHWLWQIIQLWQPLTKNKVVSSLFNPHTLRVNSSVIQLLELNADIDGIPSLEKLGNLWNNWSNNCHESIAEIVKKIARYLQVGLITKPEAILTILDRVIYHLANDNFTRKYQIITLTDPGRIRKGNEDACYPSPSEFKTITTAGIDTLTVICDGLGGQEGGEIASQSAIDTLKTELFKDFKAYTQGLEDGKNHHNWNPLVNIKKLMTAVSKANDQINQRNNQEKRHKKERMGTTLVMSLALDHEIYLTHVGDSRIYWVTDESCYQVTVDDDLASREVRFGQAFYRDIIQYPQTGALLQALGMEDSQNLYPHIQRFILERDCVFLLCSDGLSDFDRVEQYWQTEILPILNQEIDIEKAAKNLLKIGLKRNGHDNITVGLVYCQIQPKQHGSETILSWDNLNLEEVITKLYKPLKTPEELSSNLKNKSAMPVKLLALISLIVLGIGLLFYSQWKSTKNNFNPPQNNPRSSPYKSSTFGIYFEIKHQSW